jgi:hypothetical protein
MTAREEAIQAYGGACVWCGCDDSTQLEIDHLNGGQGQGNAHRRDMAARGTNINYELRRLGYPPGYRLLCSCCHQVRTYGKVVSMPPRRGHKDLHVSLPDALCEEIERLAKQCPDGSKSNVVVDLLMGQGPGWTPTMAVLVDRQTGERSAAMPWGQCMDERGTRIKASGAASLSEHYQAGARYVCEMLR